MIWVLAILIGMVVFAYLINKYQNKYQSSQGVFFNIMIVSLFLFVSITLFFSYRASGIEISDLSDLVDFSKFYFEWVYQLFLKTKNVVGYVIKQDWGFN